jgi:hypothetical protein
MSIPYTGSSSSTVLSTSPTLSSRCALSSFDGQEDGSAVDSPASSSSSREPSLDASADGMDVEFANPSEPAMPSEESFPRRTLRKRVTTSKGSSLRFKPASVSAITPRQGTSPEDNLTRKAYKQAYLQSAARAQNDREDRVRELKKRALAIPSTGKTPATWRQRLVMQMVYDEITPYPDEAWVSQLGVIINRFVIVYFILVIFLNLDVVGSIIRLRTGSLTNGRKMPGIRGSIHLSPPLLRA